MQQYQSGLTLGEVASGRPRGFNAWNFRSDAAAKRLLESVCEFGVVEVTESSIWIEQDGRSEMFPAPSVLMEISDGGHEPFWTIIERLADVGLSLEETHRALTITGRLYTGLIAPDLEPRLWSSTGQDGSVTVWMVPSASPGDDEGIVSMTADQFFADLKERYGNLPFGQCVRQFLTGGKSAAAEVTAPAPRAPLVRELLDLLTNPEFTPHEALDVDRIDREVLVSLLRFWAVSEGDAPADQMLSRVSQNGLTVLEGLHVFDDTGTFPTLGWKDALKDRVLALQLNLFDPAVVVVKLDKALVLGPIRAFLLTVQDLYGAGAILADSLEAYVTEIGGKGSRGRNAAIRAVGERATYAA